MQVIKGQAVLDLATGAKATVIALAFVLTTVLSFGSNYAVEVGAYPQARLLVEKPDVALLNYDSLLYSLFAAKIDVLPWLYVTGETTIFFFPYVDRVSFFPIYALFKVGGGLQFGPLTIGYEHRCDHAIAPYSYVADPLVQQDSGYDKVFVRYEVTF